MPPPEAPATGVPEGGTLTSSLVHQLRDYWTARRGNCPMPRKSDIDPSELKPLLPYMLVGEFATEPLRLRYRLVGTEVVTVYGVDFTGRWLDELDFGDQVAGGWAEQYRRVFETAQPVFGTARLFSTSGMEMTYEYGLFPLSQNGATPTHCIDINDYRPALRQAEESWARLRLRNSA